MKRFAIDGSMAELHKLYKKHQPVRVVRYTDKHNDDVTVFACSCGNRWEYQLGNSQRDYFTKVMATEFVADVYMHLPVRLRAPFASYLKRSGERFQYKDAIYLLYGPLAHDEVNRLMVAPKLQQEPPEWLQKDIGEFIWENRDQRKKLFEGMNHGTEQTEDDQEPAQADVR